MPDWPDIRPEMRYGLPSADQILINRQYIVGYSYLFRQPRWALQLIDLTTQMVDQSVQRADSRFRDDVRVPEMFRSSPMDYKRSGFDRGHMITSADRKQRAVVNSETFLMSNICPQAPDVNRRSWLDLEKAVRKLAAKENILEVYTVCGPLFSIGDRIAVIGDNRVMAPSGFFKSVLAEDRRGKLSLWSFVIPNESTNCQLSDFLVATVEVESKAGLSLWDRLHGSTAEKMKSLVTSMWSIE